jgi:hypothetical protein
MHASELNVSFDARGHVFLNISLLTGCEYSTFLSRMPILLIGSVLSRFPWFQIQPQPLVSEKNNGRKDSTYKELVSQNEFILLACCELCLCWIYVMTIFKISCWKFTCSVVYDILVLLDNCDHTSNFFDFVACGTLLGFVGFMLIFWLGVGDSQLHGETWEKS